MQTRSLHNEGNKNNKFAYLMSLSNKFAGYARLPQVARAYFIFVHFSALLWSKQHCKMVKFELLWGKSKHDA